MKCRMSTNEYRTTTITSVMSREGERLGYQTKNTSESNGETIWGNWRRGKRVERKWWEAENKDNRENLERMVGEVSG